MADRSPGDDPPDDPAARDAAPVGAPDEPRAGDVARAKSTADLENKLDPATIAQLAAWFDLPSFTELEERRQAEEPPTNEVLEHRKELHARIAEVADRTIVANMERWSTAGDPLIHLPPQLEIRIGQDIRATDIELDDQLGSLGEPREVEIPSWIAEAFEESTPQAILRDLHRTEDDFFLRFELVEQQPTLGEMSAALQSAIRAPLTVRPDIPPSWRTIGESLAEVRRWKAAPWGELPLPKREAEP